MLRLWSSGMCCSIAGYLSGATVADEPAASFVTLGLVVGSVFIAVGVGFCNQLKFLCFSVDKQFTRVDTSCELREVPYLITLLIAKIM